MQKRVRDASFSHIAVRSALGAIASLAILGCSSNPAEQAQESVPAPTFPADLLDTNVADDDCIVGGSCRAEVIRPGSSTLRVLEAQSMATEAGLRLAFFLPPGFEEPSGEVNFQGSDGRSYGAAVSTSGATAVVVLPGPSVNVERIVTSRIDCRPPSATTLHFTCETVG